MKISPTAFYTIWFLLQVAIFNWALILTTGDRPNIFGTALFVLFFQVAVTFPVLGLVSKIKNENS